MNSKSKKVVTIVIIVCIVLIAVLAALANFITDILWFYDLGYISVFLKKLLTQLTIGVPVFLIFLFVGNLYLRAINKGYHKRLIVADEKLGAKGQKRLSLALAAVSSLIITYTAASTIWYTFLQFTNSTSFSLADPIFSLDVSFYTFKLQFIQGLNNTVITGIVVYAFMTFIYYAILMSICPAKAPISEGGDDDEDELTRRRKKTQQRSAFSEGLLRALGIDPEAVSQQQDRSREDDGGGGGGMGSFKELIYIAQKQLVVLGVLFFLMLAVSFFLRQFDLLYTSTNVLYGMGYKDYNITLWVYRIIVVMAVIASVFFARGIVKKSVKTTFIVPGLMIGVGIIGAIVGGITQSLVVEPDAINKEGPYIKYSIDFTQKAYGLADVDIIDFAADNKLTGEDIINNSDIIRNIRINDYEPAKIFYNSTQSIRQYYYFNDVDVDRYTINGEYTQTFIAARELDYSRLPQEWLNLHIKYTHGFGFVLSRVDKVTPSGQPDTLVRNIPPESDVEEIEIPFPRPEIYFGEMTDDYIVVNTNEKEFSYPLGETNVETMYEADSGVNMNWFNRLMFSIREGDIRLLFSANVNSDSRIIINRNIASRVREIMPFLQYSDPYMVTSGGKLYWIIDAYTTSKNFPYSEPYNLQYGDTTNYVRNSVKVVIDAYTGDTGFYLIDTEDPVAATMSKIYPALFRTMGQMPEGVTPHIRYPSTLLNIQANVYKRYHVNDVTVFYQGEDRWDIAKERVGAGDEETYMWPNYYIMKIPGYESVEFVNSIPYTPKDRNNMIALLVARNDAPDYGKLVLFQLPKGQIVMGPSQIDAQIAQDTNISRDFALWENAGSTYSRGNMFVIPIENSFMYVEPIYLRATIGSLPEVKRVVIYFDGRIAYKETLRDALDEMFGSGIGDTSFRAKLDRMIDGLEPAPEAPDITDTTPTPAPAPAPTPTPDPDDTASEPGDTGTGDGASSFDQMSEEQLVQAAADAYERGQAAMRAGDWTAYGEAQNELEAILNYLIVRFGQ